MLLLTVKGKEATFAIVLMTADSQLRKRDIEGFCKNPSPIKKSNNINRKPLKKIHKYCGKDTEV